MPSRSAASRAPAGWVRVDCHLHTVASGDAVLTLEQLAERAEQTGLDVVCITDHNVTSAAVAAAERDLGVRVIVAGSDADDAPGVGAAYLEMPDFDGPAGFLAALAHARVTGEFRPHAPRYPRHP